MDMSESLTFAYLASADVLTLIRYSSCCSLAYYFLDKQLLLLIITGGTRRDGLFLRAHKANTSIQRTGNKSRFPLKRNHALTIIG